MVFNILIALVVLLLILVVFLLTLLIREKKNSRSAKKALRRYRTAIQELDRWCGGEFKIIRLTCEHIDAHGEGKALMSGTFSHDGRCTVSTFRQVLRRLKK